MADINITIDSPTIRKKNEPKPHATVELAARRTLDNNILILDHEEIDIVVYPEQQKVLALAKDEITDQVYETQDRLFKFLYGKGVIDFSTVHSGNVYGSMQAKILESKIDGVDSTQMTVFSVQKFLDAERPYFMISKAYQKAEEDRLTEPEPEESTELGEVPHSDVKGSVGSAQAYGMGGSPSLKRGRRYV
jgi:hypothetical protein